MSEMHQIGGEPPPPEKLITVFRPHPGQQMKFLSSSARDVFFGGAAGPGKSVCLIAAGLRYFAHPSYRGKIFRRTRKQATELIIKTKKFVMAAFPGSKWNGTDYAFMHPRGGRLEIGYLRHDDDLENEEGQEYAFCGFDELCQFPEHQAKFLHSRLRSDANLHLQYKATGNPRGIGLQWVKRHYIDPAPPGELHWHIFSVSDRKRFRISTQFIPGKLEDNPSLGEDYEISLASIGDKRLYEALRHGQWDALVGDAFPEWDQEWHVLSWPEFGEMHGVQPYLRSDGSQYCEIPAHWPIFMSYDWGTASPFSVGWWCSDDFGRLYRFAEWYGAATSREGATFPDRGIHMSTTDQAHGILSRERELGIEGRVELRVCDPSIRGASNRRADIEGPTILEIFSDEGIYFTLAQNNRIQGKAQMHERLRIAEFENNEGDIEETAGMMILSDCKEWLRTVPTVPRSPINPEDVDSSSEDHCYDETRYMLMSRPWRARLIKQLAPWASRRKHARSGMVV